MKTTLFPFFPGRIRPDDERAWQMKTVLFSFFLVLLPVATGCRPPAGKDAAALPVLDLGAAISTQAPDTFTLNTFARHITYVPVATSADALFGSARPVYIGDNYYCMVDNKTSTVFCTDKNGGIVHSFSHRGKGPGEYLTLTYVAVNPADSTVKVFDQRGRKFIVYDLDGRLLNEIPLEGKEIDTPVLIAGSYTVAKGQPMSSHRLYITDPELNTRQRLFPADTTCTEMERMCLVWQLNWCQNRDRAIVNFAHEDTVYTVDSRGAAPLCIFKKGKYGLPEEVAREPMEITPEGSPYIRTMRLSVVPEYYLISYMLKDRFYDEVWSRSHNRIVSRFTNANGEAGYPFRLPSGKKLRIDAKSLYIDGKVAALCIPAATAAEEKLADVGEDDNPVLVVMEW